MLAIKSINGVQPAVQPLSSGYSVTESDLLADGSGRSAETGKVIRYPVRLGTYKLTLKFKGTISEIAQVDELVGAFTQTVEFYHKGKIVTGHTFYPNDRSYSDNGYTAELSVNLIEI